MVAHPSSDLVDMQSMHISLVDEVSHFSAVRVCIERAKPCHRTDRWFRSGRRWSNELNLGSGRALSSANAKETDISHPSHNRRQTLRLFNIEGKNDQAEYEKDGSSHVDETVVVVNVVVNVLLQEIL
jgi:hypothetical protein